MESLRLELLEARRASTTAMANSRMMLKVASTCFARGEMQSVQSPASKMRLMKNVRPAAMIMKAASCLI
jgi:hypothetical protein